MHADLEFCPGEKKHRQYDIISAGHDSFAAADSAGEIARFGDML